MNHFLDLNQVDPGVLRRILDGAKSLKATRNGAHPGVGSLAGKVLAMVFEQPSTRTRVSFDVGMRELGGQTLMLTETEMQLGRGETIADTARVLSRYVDAIMIRILDPDQLRELADHATVPVINGLTRASHPCQVMADILTFEEHKGDLAGRKVAWVGDTNNVLASWIEAAPLFDFDLHIATPLERAPCDRLITAARERGARITLTTDPEVAAEAANCIITDTWMSMGDDDNGDLDNLFRRYQVNDQLMAKAPDAIFMHCLPAHRGDEVTDSVIDGPQSVVFDEAENRLHAQKGILAWCFDKLEAT